jgi:aspartyl-tRNA(Asn)/glutamyl-tRNA(Gln) amidotransferase subunit A
MTKLYRWSIKEASASLSRGEISPVDLVKSFLERIDEVESRVQAWVTLDREGAMEVAAQSKRDLESGKVKSPLHGIPIGVKDIFYTKGLKTSMGSKIFADLVPSHDATTVQRLREAGAIVLGKTVTTEFAYFDPGPTRNPWNLEHTPGGSSSGSAAAVAAEMCPAALGSQTAGSLLRPGAFCGVVSLKPTYGRISRYGIFPDSWCLDHPGFFTRSVEDATLLLQSLAGHDSKDSRASKEPVPDYHRALELLKIPVRIGLVREFFMEKADAETRRHVENVIQRFAQAGAKIEEVPMPKSFTAVQAAHRTVMRVEMTAVHEDLFRQHPDKYSAKLRELIEIGMLVPGVQYLRAQRIRNQFIQGMIPLFSQFDVLLSPTTASTAPKGLQATGDPSFNIPWTFSGFPAITLPSGLSESGLPMGIQLAAAPFREDKLLAVAYWCEKVLDFKEKPRL